MMYSSTSYFSDWSYVGRGIVAATAAGTVVLLNTVLYSPGRASGGSKVINKLIIVLNKLQTFPTHYVGPQH